MALVLSDYDMGLEVCARAGPEALFVVMPGDGPGLLPVMDCSIYLFI
jgi:hypothetical protein